VAEDPLLGVVDSVVKNNLLHETIDAVLTRVVLLGYRSVSEVNRRGR